jgi:type IV pilus assembly protein PilA
MSYIQKGFTLIELMIVVAIIGILAAVAIPAYQDYIARSQMSEAVSLLGSAKTPFSEYYADKGLWPAAATDVMGNTAGKYTDNIAITEGAGAASGIVRVTATMKATGVNTNIASKTVQLNSTDGKTWVCETGATDGVDNRYLPAACR